MLVWPRRRKRNAALEKSLGSKQSFSFLCRAEEEIRETPPCGNVSEESTSLKYCPNWSHSTTGESDC